MALYADHEGDNISWAGDDLPGWEPWEDDEPEPDQHYGRAEQGPHIGSSVHTEQP